MSENNQNHSSSSGTERASLQDELWNVLDGGEAEWDETMTTMVGENEQDRLSLSRPDGDVTLITIDTSDPKRIQALKHLGLIKGSTPTALAIGCLADFIRNEKLKLWSKAGQLANAGETISQEMQLVNDGVNELIGAGLNVAQEKKLISNNFGNKLKQASAWLKGQASLAAAQLKIEPSIEVAEETIALLERFEAFEREQARPGNFSAQEQLREDLIEQIDLAIHKSDALKLEEGGQYSSRLHDALRKARDAIQRYEYQGHAFDRHDQFSYLTPEGEVPTERSSQIPERFVYHSKDHSSHPKELYRAVEMMYGLEENKLQPHHHTLTQNKLPKLKSIGKYFKNLGTGIKNMSKGFLMQFTSPYYFIKGEISDFNANNPNHREVTDKQFKTQRPLTKADQLAFDEANTQALEIINLMQKEAQRSRVLGVSHEYNPVRYDNMLAQLVGYAKQQALDLESGAIANPGIATALGGVSAISGLAIFAPQFLTQIFVQIGLGPDAASIFIKGIQGILQVEKSNLPQKIDTLVQFAGLQAAFIHRLQKNTQALTDSDWEAMKKNPLAHLVDMMGMVAQLSGVAGIAGQKMGINIGALGQLDPNKALNQVISKQIGTYGAYGVNSAKNHFIKAKFKMGLISSILCFPLQIIIPPIRLMVGFLKAVFRISYGYSFKERMKPEWEHFKNTVKGAILAVLEFSLTSVGTALKLIAMVPNVLFKYITKTIISTINLTGKFLNRFNNQTLKKFANIFKRIAKSLLNAKVKTEAFFGRYNRGIARISSKIRHYFRKKYDVEYKAGLERNQEIKKEENKENENKRELKREDTQKEPTIPAAVHGEQHPETAVPLTPTPAVEHTQAAKPKTTQDSRAAPAPSGPPIAPKRPAVSKPGGSAVLFGNHTLKNPEPQDHELQIKGKQRLAEHVGCLQSNPKVKITTDPHLPTVSFDLITEPSPKQPTHVSPVLKNCFVQNNMQEETVYGVKGYDENIGKIKALIHLMLDNIIKLKQNEAVVCPKLKGRFKESLVKDLFEQAVQEKIQEGAFKKAGIVKPPVYQSQKPSSTPKLDPQSGS